MKHLAYCVLLDQPIPGDRLPMGMAGGIVTLLAEDGLAAAVSAAPDPDAPPAPDKLKKYARIVRLFHDLTTVLPMRYGCLFDTEAQARAFLRERREPFQRALAQLEGCDEMGLRILPPGIGHPLAEGALWAAYPLSGAAYLALRKARYADRDQEIEEVIAPIREAFKGLFVKCSNERSQVGGSLLLSLYFLVPREKIEAFRKAFRPLQEKRREKMLLTGPWPPYNFVPSERPARPHHGCGLAVP